MLKGLASIVLFIIIFIIIIALVILRFIYKGYRNIKEVQEEIINSGGKRYSRQEYIRHQREQRDKNPFGDDYFKSSDSSKKEQKEEKQKTTRRTTTSSGVTIIDDREAEEKKKIFDNTDGEYVEFEEVGD